VTDANFIRARLCADPAWAVYALADLTPAHAAHCRWLTPGPASSAIALIYSGFDTPIFWANGSAADLAPLADELFSAPQLILQIRPEMAPLVRARYSEVNLAPMWRMALSPGAFRPTAAGPADRRLSLADLPALERLYADGVQDSQQPDFFHSSMLEAGVFWGAWQGDEVVAVAGTHIVSREESAAAIGNVYTRRDARRRGHAARLTSRVTEELLGGGIGTVALSVRQSNPAAAAVYVRLGFHSHCEFFEGHAARRAARSFPQA
jgi:ribosomal protein S18 acetylase RimI-like enzyme